MKKLTDFREFVRHPAVPAAAVSALLLLLAVILLLTLPAGRVGSMVAARASTALDRDVTVERFRVKLFPRPAIAMEGVRIGGPRDAAPAAGVPAFAAADRVYLRPRILPLLRRRVIVDAIVVHRLRLRVAVDEEGRSNVPSLESGAADGEPAGDAEFRVRSLRLTDGAVAYRDARDGTEVTLSGIEQLLRLSGRTAAGEFSRASLRGTLSIGDVDATFPGRLAWPLRDLRLHFDHDLELDRAADRLTLTRLDARVQEIPLSLTGTMDGLENGDARAVDLRAGAGAFDVARLVASLPASMLAGAGGDVIEGAAGIASLDATIRGRIGAGNIPAVSGSLTVRDAALDRGRHGRIAEALTGTIGFNLDTVATSGITGRLLGEPLHLVANIRSFAAPEGRVALRTALAMAQAEKLGLLPEGAQGSGRIAVDLAASGPFAEPAGILLDGHAELAGVTLQLTALEQPAVVDQGRIRFSGHRAQAAGMRARVGGSDLQLDFTADGWLRYLLGDTAQVPVIAFDARSSRFDADEIFGVDPERYTYGQLFFARLGDRTVDGLTAAQAAERIGLGLPAVPPLHMDGRIRAARLVNGGVTLEEVDVVVAGRGGTLEVQAASFRMMGGGIHLTGRLGLAAGGSAGAGDVAAPLYVAQPLLLEYTVAGVGAQQFLQRFTTFRDHIAGEMLLRGTVRMNLDHHLLPVTQSVAGNGTVAIVDGELVNWPLVRQLGERLGVARFDTLHFSDWTGRYTFAGNRVVLDESMLEGRDMSIRAAGSFDFAGNLELGATLYLPPQWARRIPGAPAAFLVGMVAGSDSRVPVGARITGTAASPVIRLDMSEAGARLATAAQEEARRQAQEVAARVADDVATRVRDELSHRLPQRDSLAVRADSLRRSVEDNIADRLRRVLRPGGGTPPPPPGGGAGPRIE
jgi:hypothetical protein